MEWHLTSRWCWAINFLLKCCWGLFVWDFISFPFQNTSFVEHESWKMVRNIYFSFKKSFIRMHRVKETVFNSVPLFTAHAMDRRHFNIDLSLSSIRAVKPAVQNIHVHHKHCFVHLSRLHLCDKGVYLDPTVCCINAACKQLKSLVQPNVHRQTLTVTRRPVDNLSK